MVQTLSSNCCNLCGPLRLVVALLPSCPSIHRCTHHIVDDLPLNFQIQYRKGWPPPTQINDTMIIILYIRYQKNKCEIINCFALFFYKLQGWHVTNLHLMAKSRRFSFAQQCKTIISTGWIVQVKTGYHVINVLCLRLKINFRTWDNRHCNNNDNH